MRFIGLVLLVLPLLQCSSVSVKTPQSVRIELRGQPGTSNETRYYSHAHVRSYSAEQLLRDRQEIVDFTVLTSIKAFQDKMLHYTVKTLTKDGTVSLRDMAFPEKGEEIDYIVRSDGQVLKAGKYPAQSLFFVPALPTPKEEVAIGDTWSMTHAWLSANDNIPLKLDVVGILKDIVPCAGKVCADIEISGGVKLAVATSGPTVFSSRIWGRMLFSVERGEVVWSETRSEENMDIKGEKLSVISCMVSETKLTAKYKTKLECVPGVTPVLAVPKL